MASPQQSPQQQQAPQSDDALIAAVAGLLIIGASLTVTAGGIAKITKLPLEAIEGALEAAGGHPLPMAQPGTANTATAATRAANRMYRAAFVLNAGRRIASGLKQKQPLSTLVGREKTLWAMHKIATAKRVAAARDVDLAAKSFGQRASGGTLLGWYATIDGRTDPTCVAANQTNFYAETPPMIGYPGGVHAHCRCRPGPAWPGAKMTYQTSAVRRGPDSTRFYAGALR